MEQWFAAADGDARQQAAAAALRRQGWRVEGEETVSRAGYLLLPMLTPENSGHAAALLGQARPGTVAFGGRVPPMLAEKAAECGILLEDYYARPELAALNAIPTAEGVLQLLLEKLPCTLWETPVAVLGYGRCGRALGLRLNALGARVTMLARSPLARAQARGDGAAALPLTEWKQLCRCRAVVNTIPAPVLPAPVLAALPKDTLLVDVASDPGGIDLTAAEEMGLSALRAPGLPGRCAPETAGALQAAAVLEILREKGELQ